MKFDVQVVREGKRGCGYRKPRGLYLVGADIVQACGKLPLLLLPCPCCGETIRPSRWLRWVDTRRLFGALSCQETHCGLCILASHHLPDRAVLIWIGVRDYPTPLDLVREGQERGFCRQISQIPNGFEIGKTMVLFAHRHAIVKGEKEWNPAIFAAFIPQRIEYVVKGNESEKEFKRLVDRGVTLVKVERIEEPEPQLELIIEA